MTVRRFPDPAPRLDLIVGAIGRGPVLSAFDAAANAWDYTFTPDLSGPETAALDDAVRAAASGVSITYAEFLAIKSDIDGLQTYQNLPTPTLAQTALAVKAQSRILKALLRS